MAVSVETPSSATSGPVYDLIKKESQKHFRNISGKGSSRDLTSMGSDKVLPQVRLYQDYVRTVRDRKQAERGGGSKDGSTPKGRPHLSTPSHSHGPSALPDYPDSENDYGGVGDSHTPRATRTPRSPITPRTPRTPRLTGDEAARQQKRMKRKKSNPFVTDEEQGGVPERPLVKQRTGLGSAVGHRYSKSEVDLMFERESREAELKRQLEKAQRETEELRLQSRQKDLEIQRMKTKMMVAGSSGGVGTMSPATATKASLAPLARVSSDDRMASFADRIESSKLRMNSVTQSMSPQRVVTPAVVADQRRVFEKAAIERIRQKRQRQGKGSLVSSSVGIGTTLSYGGTASPSSSTLRNSGKVTMMRPYSQKQREWMKRHLKRGLGAKLSVQTPHRSGVVPRRRLWTRSTKQRRYSRTPGAIKSSMGTIGGKRGMSSKDGKVVRSAFSFDEEEKVQEKVDLAKQQNARLRGELKSLRNELAKLSEVRDQERNNQRSIMAAAMSTTLSESKEDGRTAVDAKGAGSESGGGSAVARHQRRPSVLPTIKHKSIVKAPSRKLRKWNWKPISNEYIPGTKWHTRDDDRLLEAVAEYFTGDLDRRFAMSSDVELDSDSDNDSDEEESVDRSKTGIHERTDSDSLVITEEISRMIPDSIDKVMSEKRKKLIIVVLKNLGCSPEQLRTCVVEAETNKFGRKVLKYLQHVMPSNKELMFIRHKIDYLKVSKTSLKPQELFLFCFKDMTHLNERIALWKQKIHLNEGCKLILEDVKLMRDALKSIQESLNLPRMLRVILEVGNYVNYDAKRRNPAVYGFQLDSLISLTQVKASRPSAFSVTASAGGDEMIGDEAGYNLLSLIYDLCREKYPTVLDVMKELKQCYKVISREFDNNNINPSSVTPDPPPPPEQQTMSKQAAVALASAKAVSLKSEVIGAPPKSQTSRASRKGITDSSVGAAAGSSASSSSASSKKEGRRISGIQLNLAVSEATRELNSFEKKLRQLREMIAADEKKAAMLHGMSSRSVRTPPVHSSVVAKDVVSMDEDVRKDHRIGNMSVSQKKKADVFESKMISFFRRVEQECLEAKDVWHECNSIARQIGHDFDFEYTHAYSFEEIIVIFGRFVADLKQAQLAYEKRKLRFQGSMPKFGGGRRMSVIEMGPFPRASARFEIEGSDSDTGSETLPRTTMGPALVPIGTKSSERRAAAITSPSARMISPRRKHYDSPARFPVSSSKERSKDPSSSSSSQISKSSAVYNSPPVSEVMREKRRRRSMTEVSAHAGLDISLNEDREAA